MNGKSHVSGVDPTVIGDPDGSLADVLEEYLVGLDRGAAPGRDELLARHPGIAEQLARCLDGLEVVWRTGAKFRDDSSAGAIEDRGEVPKRFGDFRIIREIGRGGMGVVYEAEQLSLERIVALKMLPFAAMLDERLLQRFKTEAHAAASLHHDHIAPVYGVGSERGIHYYAMQLIDGYTLADMVRAIGEGGSAARPTSGSPGDEDGGASSSGTIAAETLPAVAAALSTQRSRSPHAFYRHVARLGRQAAEAIHYAHTQGVLHRDIKPGNLMCDASGKLWVTDFGLAQVERRDGITMTGDLVGTLRYMSPEQVSPKNRLLDERTDVYSLGATLFELATGRPLFDQDNRGELVRQISLGEPAPLRRGTTKLPADLRTIIAKAVEREPADRYQTAQELADDLGRFVEHRPIVAKPPGLMARLRKWFVRNPQLATILAAAVCTVTILAMVAGAVSTAAYQRERQQRELAEDATTTAERESEKARQALAAETQARQDAQHILYQAHIREANEALGRGHVSRVESLLYRYIPKDGDRDLRGWEWHYLLGRLDGGSEIIDTHPSSVCEVCISPDGRLLATVSQEHVRLWDSASRRMVRELHIPYGEMHSASFSPVGSILAISSKDAVLRLWAVGHGGALRTLRPTQLGVGVLSERPAWSPDGAMVATCAESEVVVWDADRGVEKSRISLAQRADPDCIAWRPDGEELAIGYDDGDGWLLIVDVATGMHRVKVQAHQYDLWSIDYTSDGTQLATSSFDHHAKILDAETLETLHDLFHPSGVVEARFSPDDRRLACATTGQEIYLWDTNTGALDSKLAGNRDRVNSIVWSPDGKQLISGENRGAVRVWAPDVSNWTLSMPVATRSIHPNRARATVPMGNGTIGIYDFETNEVVFSTVGQNAYWSTSGDKVAIQDGNTVLVVDAETGAERTSFVVPEGHFLSEGWSGDDSILLTYDGSELRFWNAATGSQLARIDAPRLELRSWSPRDRLLAVLRDREVTIWDAGESELLAKFRDEQLYSDMANINWSPDGKRIATSGWAGRINIWEARSGRLLQKLEGHAASHFIRSVAWSRDGTLLASGGWDQSVKIWDAVNGRVLHSLDGHNAKIASVVFDSTGSRLASSDFGHVIRLWDITTGEELMMFEDRVNHNQICHLDWSRDGRMLWSHARRRNTKVRDAGRGFEMARSGELDATVARWSLSAGLRFAQTSRVEESDRAFEDAEELVGPQAWARRERAVRFLQRGMQVEAARDLELAGRVAPEEPAARNELAWLLANRNDGRVREPERAERIAAELLADWPEQGEFWTTLGLAQYRQGKWREAIESLQTASRLCLHRRARVHLILAMCHARLGDTQQAEESMKQADASWDEFEFEQNSRGPLTVDGTERLRDEAEQLIEDAGP